MAVYKQKQLPTIPKTIMSINAGLKPACQTNSNMIFAVPKFHFHFLKICMLHLAATFNKPVLFLLLHVKMSAV